MGAEMIDTRTTRWRRVSWQGIAEGTLDLMYTADQLILSLATRRIDELLHLVDAPGLCKNHIEHVC